MSGTLERSSNLLRERIWVPMLIFRCFCPILSILSNSVDWSGVDAYGPKPFNSLSPVLCSRERVNSDCESFLRPAPQGRQGGRWSGGAAAPPL